MTSNGSAFLVATGVALAGLAGAHLLSVAWFATHDVPGYATDPANPSPQADAMKRLSNPFWTFLDLATVLVALAHGGFGLNLLVEARVASRGWRSAATAAIATVLVVAAVLAAYAYLSVPAYRNPGGF